jgi:hypothetical protein
MADSVYGDMLMFFPELFQNVPYYERKPKVGAGYEEEASGYEDVIIMPEKTLTAALGGRALAESAADVLDYKDKEYVWVSSDSPVKVGTFLMDLEKGRLVRLVGRAEWGMYGGFTRFDFEIVQGTTSEPNRESTGVIKGKF